VYKRQEFQRHGAGIVGVNEEGKIILVRNYRYINDYDSWEVPAGTIPPGIDPAQCVLEELKEEAGCVADKKHLVHIGNYFPSIGSSSQIFHCYYAKNVIQTEGELDGNEILEARWFTVDEIKKMITDGTIKDGFTLVLLLRYLFLPG
jgi:ADP-ribose pyrophosphatase